MHICGLVPLQGVIKKKDTTRIRLGTELVIPSTCLLPAYEERMTGPASYRLLATVFHHGPTSVAGHYVVRHRVFLLNLRNPHAQTSCTCSRQEARSVRLRYIPGQTECYTHFMLVQRQPEQSSQTVYLHTSQNLAKYHLKLTDDYNLLMTTLSMGSCDLLAATVQHSAHMISKLSRANQRGACAWQADVRTPAGWVRCNDLGRPRGPPARRTAVDEIPEAAVVAEGHRVALILYERLT